MQTFPVVFLLLLLALSSPAVSQGALGSAASQRFLDSAPPAFIAIAAGYGGAPEALAQRVRDHLAQSNTSDLSAGEATAFLGALASHPELGAGNVAALQDLESRIITLQELDGGWPASPSLGLTRLAATVEAVLALWLSSDLTGRPVRHALSSAYDHIESSSDSEGVLNLTAKATVRALDGRPNGEVTLWAALNASKALSGSVTQRAVLYSWWAFDCQIVVVSACRARLESADAFLQDAQVENGWPDRPGDSASLQATAWALRAAGRLATALSVCYTCSTGGADSAEVRDESGAPTSFPTAVMVAAVLTVAAIRPRRESVGGLQE